MQQKPFDHSVEESTSLIEATYSALTRSAEIVLSPTTRKMKTVAAAAATMKNAGSSSASRFLLREKLQGSLQMLAVDSHNRWPVQGWSSGDEATYDLDEQVVAEECARPFTVDHEGRWPLQGWCNPPSTTFKSTGDESVAVSIKPSVRSRWPQGW